MGSGRGGHETAPRFPTARGRGQSAQGSRADPPPNALLPQSGHNPFPPRIPQAPRSPPPVTRVSTPPKFPPSPTAGPTDQLPLPSLPSGPATGLLGARRPSLRAATPAGNRRRGPDVVRPGARPERGRAGDAGVGAGATRYLWVDVAHRVVLDLPEHLLGNFGRLVRHGRGGPKAPRRLPPRQARPRGSLPNGAARAAPARSCESGPLPRPRRPRPRRAAQAREPREPCGPHHPARRRGGAEGRAVGRRRPAPLLQPAAPRTLAPSSLLQRRGPVAAAAPSGGSTGVEGKCTPLGGTGVGQSRERRERGGPSRQHARPQGRRMRAARGGPAGSQAAGGGGGSGSLASGAGERSVAGCCQTGPEVTPQALELGSRVPAEGRGRWAESGTERCRPAEARQPPGRGQWASPHRPNPLLS